jgi:predicted dehydrogenase
VGAGIMGRWHADAVARLGARVATVIDPDRDRADLVARRYRGCRAFADMGDALGLADVFHICTPTGSHAHLAERALTAGRHVIVEKPLADTAADTARLFDLAAARNVRLCPVYQFLFQRGVQRALALMPAIAPVRDVQMTFWSAGAQGRSPRVQDATAFEILPHPFYLLPHILAIPVMATDWTVIRPGAGELRLNALAGGVVPVSIRVSMHARPTTANAVVAGERGTLAIDFFHGFSIRKPGTGSRTRKIVQPFHDAAIELGTAAANLARRTAQQELAYPGLRELIRRTYAAIAGSEPPPIGRADAMTVALASDAVADRLGIRAASSS